jgi:hypothetical protein
MSVPATTRLRRILRSPWTITAELSGIALSGLAATLVDQHPTAAARQGFEAARPAASLMVRILGLDRVFTSSWFLGLVALAACSLILVVWEQWRRLGREWGPPTEGSFRTAPYRREFTRRATGDGRRVRITTRGRAGSLGSPLFHTGLLVVAIAGVGRMLVSADAVGQAVEREVIPAGPAGFEIQERGLVAAPVALSHPIRFVELVPSHYASGDLLRLSARIAPDPGSPATIELAVNAPLDLGGTRLYLTQEFGPAFILEFQRGGAPMVRSVMLRAGDSGDYEWTGSLPDGPELRVRAPASPGAARPPSVLDVRVLSWGALKAAGRMQPGSTLELPDGGRITLREVRWWVKLVGSRDPSAWPVFLGFGIAITGVILLFAVIRTDLLVAVDPAGEEERVVVALRPRRLAPIFSDRFERLVEEQRRRG